VDRSIPGRLPAMILSVCLPSDRLNIESKRPFLKVYKH
jgi:hypothetical protein